MLLTSLLISGANITNDGVRVVEPVEIWSSVWDMLSSALSVLNCIQEILTQLRTIFDLIINFHKIQNSMYHAAKDELEARQNYDDSKLTSEQRVNNGPSLQACT